MSIPRAFFGSATDGRVMLIAPVHQDGGNPIAIRAQTNDLAPAGAAQDCTFDRVYVTTTRSHPVNLIATPIVDGRADRLARFRIMLPQPAAPREPHTFERILSQIVDGGYAQALRGRWFALRLESDGGVEGRDVIFDEVVLEYTPLSPTRR